MHDGALLAEGAPGEIERDEAVVRAYLGGGRSGRAVAGR
jgi:ABC-type branched-subunit amino acid transport system ATPase component